MCVINGYIVLNCAGAGLLKLSGVQLVTVDHTFGDVPPVSLMCPRIVTEAETKTVHDKTKAATSIRAIAEGCDEHKQYV